jgi:hypothetical protein
MISNNYKIFGDRLVQFGTKILAETELLNETDISAQTDNETENF